MCLFRNTKRGPLSRQQRRKLERDLVKLERKVRNRAIHTLNDERIPKWIRDVKRAQLDRVGFLNRRK